MDPLTSRGFFGAAAVAASTARASRAAGGPACRWPASHGPRPRGVAMKRSPAGMKNAGLTVDMPVPSPRLPHCKCRRVPLGLMKTISSPPLAGWRIRVAVRRVASLVPTLCALAGFAAAPTDSRILFAGDGLVPRPVQVFAWRVIETRCNYQRHEREQRSFWAFDAKATRLGGSVIYSISILSELAWKKTDPPAIIEMTVVDDGGLRLTALRSSFVVCALQSEPAHAA